ncbi:MAG: calcium/sodium antiporter [Gammaproteobacteria bacterium]|nr:MAG: calcium/sodium antiporter [Gammaproteobacteria bacterium]RKZ72026.1 MAG: calcium/sodium antiporter [Gammaproteobacteria bacterium]
MILNYLGILAGLALLVYGADRFVDGAANIARYLGMPPLLIGLTIVGMATSAPEILVGVVAALEGKTEIAIGNAIGSNIANIGLVLGFTVMLMPVTIASQTLKREFFIMGLAIFLAVALMWDRNLSHLDAVFLLIGLVAAILSVIVLSKKSAKTDPLLSEFESELSEKSPEKSKLGKSIFLFFLGLGLLLGGAYLLVECAILVAKHFGLSDLVIGLTIIAIGTSLPELAASITAVKKGEADIAIGNVIGSNMFNMLAVIGIPGMIHATDFDSIVLFRDFPVMIGMTLLMGYMVFIRGAGKFDRAEGSVLLLGFIAYQYWLFSG